MPPPSRPPASPARFADPPFWRTTPLDAMTRGQWESLCDGCGRCCVVKLEDEDTADIHYTDVGCRLLDPVSCRCSDYPGRQAIVPDCLKLTPDILRSIGWLPGSCAYRRLAEGRGLAWWHPLVSGDPNTVHEAGVSVQNRLSALETDVDPADLVDRVVDDAWLAAGDPTRDDRRPRRGPDGRGVRRNGRAG